MRKAGCIQISYGVESGSERIRKFLLKNISIEKIKSGEIRKGRGPGTFTDQPLHLTPGPGERRASPEEIRRRIRRNLQMQQGGKRNDDSDPKQTAIDRLHRRAGGKGKRARKARRRLNRLAKRDDGSQD